VVQIVEDALALLSADQDILPSTEAMCSDVREQLAAMRAQIQHDAVLLQQDLGSWANEHSEHVDDPPLATPLTTEGLPRLHAIVWTCMFSKRVGHLSQYPYRPPSQASQHTH
jgi:hypothetical protein